jgi:hypothetical protein
MADKHDHYFKDCPYNKIDVYRILEIYNVTDPVQQHIVKKALCLGERGHKNLTTDLNNIIDSCRRKLEMLEEEECLKNC